MPDRTARRSGRSLATRLVTAFVAVAVAAIATLAVLTLLAARSQVSALVEQQRQATVNAVTAALAAAYEQTGSWQAADLRPARTLAAAAPATLEVRTRAGGEVSTPALEMANMMTRMHGTPLGALDPPLNVPVTVDGVRVGTAVLRFPTTASPGPERQLGAALSRSVLMGAAVAVALAAGVAIFVARRIIRPVARLSSAVAAFEHGNPDARAPVDTDVAELEQLAHGFNRMAVAITRREQQRRALAADIAHELRTPLTTLQASLEGMRDGVEPVDAERLASLHDEVLRLGAIVRDLEALSAAEAAELIIEQHPVELAEVVADAAAALGPQLATAELDLQTRTEPCVVRGDAVRLRQVVTNLLTNAVKFTPPGGTVTLSVMPTDGAAELSVADTGRGIAADELPRMFDRFWRGSSAAGTSGSGIGLAVVAELIHAHGGEVRVDSRAGEGTTVTARLPIVGGQRR